jgi:ribonuclease HI
MPWSKHRLNQQEVWARVDAAGALVADAEGRVDVIYKPKDGQKIYRAGARNLTPLGGPPLELVAGERAEPRAAASAKPAAAPAMAADAIHVWTDGACSGNPGPAGLGVVIIDGANRRELSEYLGEGTNNIAELTAILRGLEEVTDHSRPVIVYSDSQYSIDMLTKGWKAKKNLELIAELRGVCRGFRDLRFVKVAGHAGIPDNERTDQLATAAVARRR